MYPRRIARPAAVTGVAVLVLVLSAGSALAGGDEPSEDGLITADDLSEDWEEGPPDEDDDENPLDEAAADIDACQGIIELQEDVEGAPRVEGSTFTLGGEEIKSGVAQVSTKAAKRAVKTYRTEGAECFEELLGATPVSAEYEILTDNGKGPDVGDGSGFITAVLTGEDESTGEPFEFVFQLVIVRAGGTIAVYEYESQNSTGAGGEDFSDAVEAAGERLAEAA